MALIIAGERSGAGKTTITLALLAALKRRGFAVQSFKVGPDYIDPMFHEYVTGRPCRNLDPVLTSESYVQTCFRRHQVGVDCGVIEGVMGLFDGLPRSVENAFPVPFGSTAHIGRLLDIPVVLVIDCSRLSGSVAAIAQGFRYYDPNLKFAGVILNRVGSDRHLALLQDALAAVNLPILGIFRRQDNITIPDRHLGLVPTGELPQLDSVVEQLAILGETGFNWDSLLPLLDAKPTASPHLPPEAAVRVRIAIAYDKAFNFYYRDNLDLLQQLGAELVFWSPLSDSQIPDKIQGFYFGGGFPEVFASELAANQGVKQALRQSILTGTPTYAECGGLMYLCEAIADFTGQSYPMLGILPTTAQMGKRLTLGYRKAIALGASPAIPPGMTVRGHEFHRSELTQFPSQPLFSSQPLYPPQTESFAEGWQLPQVHASYLHLHWGECLEIPQRFIQQCLHRANLPIQAL
ncbi:MAG: cobyrinate a,c-diamide synthase [Desertifilum sp.]|nr:cobyrinate a,c-diamide synthase [Desertifilum sp.]